MTIYTTPWAYAVSKDIEQHAHNWKLALEDGRIIALCADALCGAKLEWYEIEARLNAGER